MAVKPNRKPMKFASGAKDRQQRNAIEAAIADAMSDESGRAMSDSDMDLVNEMLGKKERLAMSMIGESGKTISDADREIVDALFANTKGELGRMGMTPSKPRMLKPKPRPDVGAIERGNRAARRTAQDLANMEAGGLVGGQVKLDKNKDGKISGADFKMMKNGGEVKGKKGKKGKKSKGNICRGGGAALRGTKFSGVR